MSTDFHESLHRSYRIATGRREARLLSSLTCVCLYRSAERGAVQRSVHVNSKLVQPMTNLTPSAGGPTRLWLVCGEFVTFTPEQVRGNLKTLEPAMGRIMTRTDERHLRA